MMSFAEQSVAAACMTLFGYGVAPPALALYLAGARRRKRRLEAECLHRKSGGD